MNNSVRPKLRKQIHPDVLTLLDRYDPHNLLPQLDAPNYSNDGAPLWNGPSIGFYERLLQNEADTEAFVHLMRSDYPSYCAVLVKIRAKRLGRVVPFFFNRGQVRLWEKMRQRIAAKLSLWIVILKARQFGMSTFVIVWGYWHTWRLEDETAVFVGDSDVLVHDFIDRIAVIHDELPDLDWFKPELRQGSKKSRVPKKQLEYVDRRTKILTMVDTQVKVGLVGKHILLSEFAKYTKPDTLLEDLRPMLPAIGSPARLECSLFIETTPRGKTAFYDLWQQAKAGESEWVAFFCPWFVLEDEYSMEAPVGWKADKELKEFWKRCNHERMKLEGLPVTEAQMYWYWQELSNADFDQDKMDRQYPTDDETCFLIGNDSVFKRQIRFVKECVQDAEQNVAKMWLQRAVYLPEPSARGSKPITCWRGELLRVDPNDAAILVAPPDPYSNNPPPRFTPLFIPMLGPDGKKITGPHANCGRLATWSPPLPGHIYVGGIDAAGGVGENRAVVSILDVCCGFQAAEFVDEHCGPEYLADEAVALGYWYNTAMLNPEVVGIGSVTMKRMKQVWRYPRVALEEKWDEVTLKKNKFGVYMNEDMKRILVMNLRWMLEERYLQLSSDPLLSELSTFEKRMSSDGKESYGCEPPAYDDRVIAVALACYAIKQSPKLIGYIRAKRPLPSADALGLNETVYVDEPTGMPDALQPEDPRRAVKERLPKALQDIVDGMDRSEMTADPFEPAGGW